MDKQVKAEPTTIEIHQSNSKCPYCQAKITAENELRKRIDERESEILNLNNQIQNIKLELSDKEMKL